MTLHNAHPDAFSKKAPLIKAASFTQLTETEVAQMRNFIDLDDPDIQANEVFYYGAMTTGVRDIEGDDFKGRQQTSDAAGASNDIRRTKVKQLVQDADGKIATIVADKKVAVMWYDNTVSPADFKRVEVTLI